MSTVTMAHHNSRASSLLFCAVFNCVTDCFKTQWLKTKINIYYLSFSVCQECGSDSAGWFWLELSPEAAVRMSDRAVVTRRAARGCNTASKLVLAISRKPQSLTICDPPQGYLGVLTTWQLACTSLE